jgi:tetratricopeptide (TPR) repeat protein
MRRHDEVPGDTMPLSYSAPLELSRPSQAPGAIEDQDVLMRLSDGLKRAQSEYALGHFEEVRAALERLATSVDAVKPQAGEEAQTILLSAMMFALLGRTYACLRRLDESTRASRQAVERFDAWLQGSPSVLGSEISDYGIALELTDDERARAALSKAIELGYATPETYLYLGVYELRDREFAAAENYLNKAGSLDSRELQIVRLQALSQALESQGLDTPDRLHAAVDAYFSLAGNLHQTGRTEEALAQLGHALKLKSDDASLLAAKGEILRALGRLREALAALDQALALDPKYTFALASKAVALGQLGRYEEALVALDQALALDPNYMWALGSKGEALRQLGRYEDALLALQQALALEPN